MQASGDKLGFEVDSQIRCVPCPHQTPTVAQLQIRPILGNDGLFEFGVV